MNEDWDRRVHDTLDFLGIRAQATAVALLQLCRELRDVGVLSEEAMTRIKESIAREVALARPRSIYKVEYDAAMRRMDDLFAGETELGKPPSTVA